MQERCVVQEPLVQWRGTYDLAVQETGASHLMTNLVGVVTLISERKMNIIREANCAEVP